MLRKHISLLLVLKAMKKLGEAPISTIQKEAGVPNYYTVKQILSDLKEIGITEERYNSGPPGKFVYGLTEKGKKAADLAEQLLTLLGEASYT